MICNFSSHLLHFNISDGLPCLAPVNLQKHKGKSSRSWTNGRLTGPSRIRRQIDHIVGLSFSYVNGHFKLMVIQFNYHALHDLTVEKALFFHRTIEFIVNGQHY